MFDVSFTGGPYDGQTSKLERLPEKVQCIEPKGTGELDDTTDWVDKTGEYRRSQGPLGDYRYDWVTA